VATSANGSLELDVAERCVGLPEHDVRDLGIDHPLARRQQADPSREQSRGHLLGRVAVEPAGERPPDVEGGGLADSARSRMPWIRPAAATAAGAAAGRQRISRVSVSMPDRTSRPSI
jgi:hypothetical protein